MAVSQTAIACCGDAFRSSNVNGSAFGQSIDSGKIALMIHGPSQDTLALLSKSAIFRNLKPAQLEEIVSSAHHFQVQRRSFLFHQGEPAHTFYCTP